MNCDCLTIHLFLVEEMWITGLNPILMLFEELGCPILLSTVNEHFSFTECRANVRETIPKCTYYLTFFVNWGDHVDFKNMILSIIQLFKNYCYKLHHFLILLIKIYTIKHTLQSYIEWSKVYVRFQFPQ
jgi:hypothetical protein